MDPLTPCGCCQLRAADKELQTPYTWLGATEVYAHMLRECFGIHVTLSGEGSCGICSVCVGRLRDASDFKLQVQRTQAELQARLKEETPGNGEESALESVTEWGDAGSDCSGEPVWIALDGAAGADPEPAPSVSLRARQQLAMACCVRLARLRDSPRASQPCPAPPPATVQREPRTQPYTCDTCQAHFTHKSTLLTHIQNLCERRNKRETLLVEHNENKPHVCNVCNKGFSKTGYLKRHENTHSGVKPYVCKVCNKRFTLKPNLKRHENTHSGVKPYICKICNKRFTQKSSLNIHENIHSGVKPYVCKVCNKRFTRKDNLNSHENTHSGVKPYVCKVCNKLFTQKSNLKRHEITYHDVKSVNGGFIRKTLDAHTHGLACDMHLTQQGAVENKRAQHGAEETNKQLKENSLDKNIGLKSYACEECKNQFPSQSELDRHKRIHSGEESYECEICESLFFDEASLITHVNTHAGRVAKI